MESQVSQESQETQLDEEVVELDSALVSTLGLAGAAAAAGCSAVGSADACQLGLPSLSFGGAMRVALCGPYQRPGSQAHQFKLQPGSPSARASAHSFAAGKIAVIARSGVSFYIGITENHVRRLEEHLASGRHWSRMVLLVEAVSSRDTAALEVQLIAQFRAYSTCLNIGRGGECASAASPHFLYVMVGQNGLLRRAARRGTR